MLDTDTKRRIDTARDILVGKVPDPKSQVEQITIALIYKFMDDMDAESEELGGKRKFFEGEFARYGWANLMHAGLGGFEILNLYAEAIAKMPENPGIPPLFRDIFKNAYLPYRDPETLKMFLKVIDEFSYDHSERLGDAFEYLLSVLGSQGDAGQFRTPRHIIDFMVEVIDPKKTETVLDPACGTAGFLISSWKHILKANTDAKGHSTLTPEEKGRLAQNFRGYDISPDMVRLSLVNMYLHGFVDPHIYEYDTLASQDKWNEYADVILANPPFMSPKGGIQPHKRFSVQSKRSEVLFVDYMAEHLTPTGRAAIIVPEGIIFQSQTAYKQLRKMLVDDYLVAVVSLPAGVFNPYSGVKTSILILDKPLAKQTSTIAFFKIENDGTDLGARRKAVGNSDLPETLNACRLWIANLVSGEQRDPKENLGGRSSLFVPKARISADGDYNLTAERYREDGPTAGRAFPMAKIGDLVAETSTRVRDSVLPVWSVSNAMGFVNTGEYFDKQVASDDIANYKVVENRCFAYNPSRINVGSIALNNKNESGAVSPMYVVFSVSDEALSADYLFALLKSEKLNREFNRVAQGGVRVQVRFKDLAELQIPLPPLEVQKEIVAEIKGYQKVIDGARAVLDNYRPHIRIDPDWPMVTLDDSALFRIESGGTPRSGVAEYWDGSIAWATLVDLPASHGVTEIFSTQRTISERGLAESSAKVLPKNSVIVSTRATIGRIGINRVPLATNQGFKNVIIENAALAIPEYVAFALTNLVPTMEAWATGGTFKELSKSKFSELQIPLPPLAKQQAIVAEIEAEQALVAANRELIARMEKKIQATLARVWGETEPTPAKA